MILKNSYNAWLLKNLNDRSTKNSLKLDNETLLLPSIMLTSFLLEKKAGKSNLFTNKINHLRIVKVSVLKFNLPKNKKPTCCSAVITLCCSC